MANILRSYAKNQDYHREQRDYSSSTIYARLFHAYLNGQGVQKDNDLACHYFGVAIELNDDPSTFILSNSVFRIIKDNISDVYSMALKQSEYNDKSANIILGILYLGGIILLEETKSGDRKIYSSVFEDISDLSDNGSYDENLAIGTMIAPKDYKKAFKYFIKAANTGDSWSKLIVGFMYHCGYGTKQNFIKACEYYQNLSNSKATDSTSLNIITRHIYPSFLFFALSTHICLYFWYYLFTPCDIL